MTEGEASPEVVGQPVGIGFCHFCVVAWKQAANAQQELPKVAWAITYVPAAAGIPGPGGQVAGVTSVPLPACFNHVPAGAAKQQSGLLVADLRMGNGSQR